MEMPVRPLSLPSRVCEVALDGVLIRDTGPDYGPGVLIRVGRRAWDPRVLCCGSAWGRLSHAVTLGDTVTDVV